MSRISFTLLPKQTSKKEIDNIYFLAARISIARSWRSPTILFDLLKAKLSWMMVNECLSAILHDKIGYFEKIWDPWIKYLSGAT